MNFFEELGFFLFAALVIYTWNTYVVPHFVKKVVKMNNRPWLNRNESKIIRGYKIFYWSGLVIYILAGSSMLIFSQFKS